METITQEEIRYVEEAQQGSRQAFGELVKLYQKPAYAIAYGFVRNREDALEIAQEAFVKAYRAMSRFDTSRPFYPWIYRIVKNTCLNHIKKRNRRGETSFEGLKESGVDFAARGRGPDGVAGLGELRERIAGGMEQLTEDHQEILTLRHVQELSYNEIAECLQIPRGTVMSRLHGARRNLRTALESPV